MECIVISNKLEFSFKKFMHLYIIILYIIIRKQSILSTLLNQQIQRKFILFFFNKEKKIGTRKYSKCMI